MRQPHDQVTYQPLLLGLKVAQAVPALVSALEGPTTI